jgi:hypothetical protein
VAGAAHRSPVDDLSIRADGRAGCRQRRRRLTRREGGCGQSLRPRAPPKRDEKGTYIQVWADPQNSEWNTIVAFANPSFQVNDQDDVHVTGTVKGRP